MTQLLQLKEREKNAARDSWQKKVEDLLDQVTGMITSMFYYCCEITSEKG